MKKQSILLLLLAILFVMVPVMQHISKINQENSIESFADLMPEAEDISSENENIDGEELNMSETSQSYLLASTSFYYYSYSEHLQYPINIVSPPPQR